MCGICCSHDLHCHASLAFFYWELKLRCFNFFWRDWEQKSQDCRHVVRSPSLDYNAGCCCRTGLHDQAWRGKHDTAWRYYICTRNVLLLYLLCCCICIHGLSTVIPERLSTHHRCKVPDLQCISCLGSFLFATLSSSWSSTAGFLPIGGDFNTKKNDKTWELGVAYFLHKPTSDSAVCYQVVVLKSLTLFGKALVELLVHSTLQ